jgi:hypothetical protein
MRLCYINDKLGPSPAGHDLSPMQLTRATSPLVSHTELRWSCSASPRFFLSAAFRPRQAWCAAAADGLTSILTLGDPQPAGGCPCAGPPESRRAALNPSPALTARDRVPFCTHCTELFRPPGNARVAVWTRNVEISPPDAAQRAARAHGPASSTWPNPTGAGTSTHACRFWRFLAVLKARSSVATLVVNGSAHAANTRRPARRIERLEFMGHGFAAADVPCG